MKLTKTKKVTKTTKKVARPVARKRANKKPKDKFPPHLCLYGRYVSSFLSCGGGPTDDVSRRVDHPAQFCTKKVDGNSLYCKKHFDHKSKCYLKSCVTFFSGKEKAYRARYLCLPNAIDRRRDSFEKRVHNFLLLCKSVTDHPEERGLPFVPNEILYVIWELCKPKRKVKKTIKRGMGSKKVEKLHKMRHGKYKAFVLDVDPRKREAFMDIAGKDWDVLVRRSLKFVNCECVNLIEAFDSIKADALLTKREYNMGALVRERQYKISSEGQKLGKVLMKEENKDEKGVPHGYFLRLYENQRGDLITFCQGHLDHGKKVGVWKEITNKKRMTVINYSEPSPRFCLEYVMSTNGEVVLHGKGFLNGKQKMGKWKYYYSDEGEGVYSIVKFLEKGSVYKKYGNGALEKRCIVRKKGNKVEFRWKVVEE